MQYCIVIIKTKTQTATGSAKINNLFIHNLATYDLFKITTQISTIHDGKPFKAYRMLIFHLELEVFIIM